jgi:hypothetical protein
LIFTGIVSKDSICVRVKILLEEIQGGKGIFIEFVPQTLTSHSIATF